ncbi:MAG: carboxypeptidase-like regulatory domain-containing protein [candidate division Zixibacteria bacterium]|nr:carboxypeptidase-like regulatory domain-containing protein [candidate division Zixibacteria bacterium]NIS18228.1 carboxypeptidase-like regulatory domain-containing protein [candidate division Zixibacteria bacterium]NIS49259.1 carboxypeptidase-like regulatory domain-containing protein [candidate division Zixibacteria bacterium]NIT54518.1 carboxypeptidase-like regulatory domain-containing protein [candidate division Zixibacteria bacterium]NIU17357.1 carboxypeptidase-like regulatory domain-cont
MSLPDGYVSGYVYEAGTTTPIDSVKIYIPSTDVSAFSDESGYYILHAFPVSYTLMAERDGYQGSSAEIRLVPNDTITQDFELQKE